MRIVGIRLSPVFDKAKGNMEYLVRDGPSAESQTLTPEGRAKGDRGSITSASEGVFSAARAAGHWAGAAYLTTVGSEYHAVNVVFHGLEPPVYYW